MFEVQPPTQHSPAASLMLDTAAKLKWQASEIFQNGRVCADKSQLCQFGCAKDNKRSVLVVCLEKAVKTGYTQVAVGVRAVSLRWDERGRVCGVDCLHMGTGRHIVMSAPRVVASCGALGSPNLLQASGIKHPLLGKHLALHPVHFLNVQFPERCHNWEGQMLTSVVTHWDNYDGSHYGPKFEVTPLSPELHASMCLGRTPRHIKSALLNTPYMMRWFSIIRDCDSTESVDGDQVHFKWGEHDKKSALLGLQKLAEMGEAAGASVLTVSLGDVEPMHLSADAATRKKELAEFQAQIAASRIEHSLFGSAHQMGSVRMAASRSLGVVRPCGELWDHTGVWVADASILPTATGVNPWFSTATMAYFVAKHLQKEIDRTKN